MHLADLFRGYRHSEPRVLFGIRIFTMIVLLAGLLGYLAFEVAFIRTDNPVIVTSYIEEESIPAPSKDKNIHIYVLKFMNLL
jgi:hypothetical protein